MQPRPPRAVLAMGGFTSAPPVLAGKHFGAKTFLHDSNTIPGRANRWLAHVVDEAFVGFPQAAHRLWIQRHAVTGTPVREQFAPADAASCRMALGLDPRRPTLVITGGSQGARAFSEIVPAALTRLPREIKQRLRVVQQCRPEDLEEVRGIYQRAEIAAELMGVTIPEAVEMIRKSTAATRRAPRPAEVAFSVDRTGAHRAVVVERKPSFAVARKPAPRVERHDGVVVERKPFRGLGPATGQRTLIRLGGPGR